MEKYYPRTQDSAKLPKVYGGKLKKETMQQTWALGRETPGAGEEAGGGAVTNHPSPVPRPPAQPPEAEWPLLTSVGLQCLF